MANYHIEFDIAAVILYLIVLFFHLTRKHYKDRLNLIYISLLIVAILTAVSDALSAHFIMVGTKVWPVVLFTELYYVFMVGIVFFLLSYVLYQLETDKNMSQVKKHCLRLPIFWYMIIVLTNSITGLVFSYSVETGYKHGVLWPMSYVVCGFYVGWAFIYAQKRRKVIDRHLRLAILNICVADFITLIVQIIFPEYMLISFGFAIGMVVLAFTSTTRNALIDQSTGMLNREIMDSELKKLYFNQDHFIAYFIRIADYDQLTGIYGIQKTEPLVREIAIFLRTFVPIGRAFQTNNSTFVLICDDKTEKEEILNTIETKLSSDWYVDGELIPFSHLFTYILVPEKAANMDSFMAYLTYFEKMKKMRYGLVPPDELTISDKVRETQIERAIRRCLENGGLSIYYQPICTAKDQKFVTAEALIRMNDKELGSISPAEFIPVAEKNGLMIEVGNFVIEEVCRFISKNNLDRLGISYIEVNLSVVQCLQRDFIDFVKKTLDMYHVDPRYICFEITETASNCAPKIFTSNLNDLSANGHLLALDDFGTGYGNLQRMLNSPFSIVKFDKDMTTQICSTEETRKAFVKMIALFRTIEQHLVMEGVETEDQYNYLKDVGADYIQGYYFSRPVPEKEFLDFIEKRL